MYVPESFPVVQLSYGDVFPASDGEEYLSLTDWSMPVQYFVGRNGSGKSRTARALAEKLGGRFLSTDRLMGLMNFQTYTFGSVAAEDYRGVPIAQQDREMLERMTTATGMANRDLYVLRDQPEVALRLTAFLKRTLGRLIEPREASGFLDPFVRMGDVDYSLLRDEGHGLREMVVLLAATYRQDWPLLIVDEPELHLHPSMARLWLAELNRECQESGRRAIVVTHEPTMLKPRTRGDLRAIWSFAAERRPLRIGDQVEDRQADRIAASLKENPQLVSQLVFSPRPVLVEGATDVAALSVALDRACPPEVAAQTDLVSHSQ